MTRVGIGISCKVPFVFQSQRYIEMLGWNFVIIFIWERLCLLLPISSPKRLYQRFSVALPIGFQALLFFSSHSLDSLPCILPALFFRCSPGADSEIEISVLEVSQKVLLGSTPVEGREETSIGQRGREATAQFQWRSDPLGSAEAGGLFIIVPSWGVGAKFLYSPCQPVSECGLPWERSMSCVRTVLNILKIAESCLLVALQQPENQSFSPERGSEWHITVSTPPFWQRYWRWRIGWGMGMRSCRQTDQELEKQ